MRFLIQAVGSRIRGQYDKVWESHEVKKSRLVFIAEHDKINKEIAEDKYKNAMSGISGLAQKFLKE